MSKFFIVSSEDYCETSSIATKIKSSYKDKVVSNVKKADFVLCLGGDGTMLRAIHEHHKLNIPFYGINRGNVGFLLNELEDVSQILENVENSKRTRSFLLEGELTTIKNKKKKVLAVNEISFLRSLPAASHVSVNIDSKEPQIEKLIADGILVSSAIGSTAYNRACKGAIVPVDSKLMSITPINPFSPINWNGAVVSNKSTIFIENLDTKNRKINCSSDYEITCDIKSALIKTSSENYVDILFHSDNNILKKTLSEQFTFIH